METTSSAGGALAVAAILTAVLPSTLEDLLALALCGALAYVSFLNWPLKRADIKPAIAERYDTLGAQLDAELAEELERGTGKLKARTQKLIAPLLEEAREIQATVEGRQARLEVRRALCTCCGRTHVACTEVHGIVSVQKRAGADEQAGEDPGRGGANMRGPGVALRVVLRQLELRVDAGSVAPTAFLAAGCTERGPW